MAKKQKYYVVWQGLEPGIYSDWASCERQVKGQAGARYKSFESREEAEEAYRTGYVAPAKPTALERDESGIAISKGGGPVAAPELNSIAVDAACSGNPGVMEYQGVYTASGTRLFHYRAERGTNNIGEFLAIVHGLSYLKKHGLALPLYSDSVNAISWVRQKTCRSKLPVDERTRELWDYVHRAEQWLRSNTYTTQILKWDTDHWGEIPADFGRK